MGMEVLFEDETDKSSDGGEEWNTMFPSELRINTEPGTAVGGNIGNDN